MDPIQIDEIESEAFECICKLIHERHGDIIGQTEASDIDEYIATKWGPHKWEAIIQNDETSLQTIQNNLQGLVTIVGGSWIAVNYGPQNAWHFFGNVKWKA